MNSTLLNELEKRGCAISEMLEQTYMGNEAFYVKMLTKMTSSGGMVKLQDALLSADVNALFSASHDLKGVYGTLGLTPLYEKCCEIVEIARAGSMEGLADKIAVLAKLHEELMKLISENS